MAAGVLAAVRVGGALPGAIGGCGRRRNWRHKMMVRCSSAVGQSSVLLSRLLLVHCHQVHAHVRAGESIQ
ncbi:hypothetical protein O3P69_001399 [Scylla paramamosain]|uniref:Secreted protein n=1 Tax=Scylla paramamosain TaxID=85552 RepID=A0AAW0US11_SCYPA